MALSCLITDDDRLREVPDLVELVVGIQHLNTNRELADLYVCWGHPSGYVELDLLDKPIPLDDAAWAMAEAAVPRIVSALRDALARGRPPDGALSPFPY